MLKLLHHSLTEYSETSPFDDAIVQVARGQPIKIVSPYIGLKYIKRLVNISSSWQIISDVDEWLAAAPRSDRPLIQEFIEEETNKIRHYPGIHAKTVIGPLAAYVGSANLTLKGLLSREELGFLVSTAEHLQDLHHWFDALWNQTTPPDIDQIREIVKDLNKYSENFENKNIKIINRSVIERRAKLVELDEKNKNKVVSSSPRTEIKKLEMTPVAASIHPASSIKKNVSTLDRIEELERFIDLNSKKGFSFLQVITHLRSLGIKARVKETYFDILPYCANLARSVFSPETLNRLIYVDGRFMQSNKQLLEPALALFDSFLQDIIHHFDFKEYRLLQATTFSNESNRTNQHQTKILIDSLLKNGFFIEENGFRLNESWIWHPRFKLFTKSNTEWETKRRILLLSRSKATSKQKNMLADQNFKEVDQKQSHDNKKINQFQPTTDAGTTPKKLATEKIATAEAKVAQFEHAINFLVNNCLTHDKKFNKYTRSEKTKYDSINIVKMKFKSINAIINSIIKSDNIGLLLRTTRGKALNELTDKIQQICILNFAKQVQCTQYDDSIRAICKSYNLEFQACFDSGGKSAPRSEWIRLSVYLKAECEKLTPKGNSTPYAKTCARALEQWTAIQDLNNALREVHALSKSERKIISA